jgi:hypothetical protein
MKKIFFTVLCVAGMMCSMVPATAQTSGNNKVKSAINAITPDWMPPFKLGVTAGFNASTFSHSGYDTQCGYQIGLDAMVDMSSLIENTYLRTGLAFVRKGAQLDCVLGNGSHDITYRPGYLQLPVRYGYGFVLDDDCVFFGEFGPYFALGLGGKVTDDYTFDGYDYEFKHDFFDYADRFDFGFGLHAGVILCKHHQISLGYDFGLLNMSDAFSQNRSFMLSYTYYIK